MKLRHAVILAALLAITYAMSGCATRSPDGTTTTLDPAATAAAIELIKIGAAEYDKDHPVRYQK